MNGNKLFTILLSLLLVSACSSYIDEANQLIYVKQGLSQRVVLLEDFTGQRCVNCPLGTEKIEQLMEAYPDSIVVVGIHGGPLGFKGNSANMGLATDLGDTYYNYWNLEYQPVGLIDRHGAVNYTDWTTSVIEELQKPSMLTMKAHAELTTDGIDITVSTTGIDGTVNGKLQVWLTEDGITALQLMPDGTANRDYVHNHVLRTAVNGMWGEDLTVSAGETKTVSMTQAVDAQWNKANLSIVAFVYNDQGVQQTVKAKVIFNQGN